MTQNNNPNPSNIIADEGLANEFPARPQHDVEVRHRGRLSTLMSMFSCCGRSSLQSSIHFHANRVEDSVHVMIKHDKEACKKQGVPTKGYTPRKPLAEIEAAARKKKEAELARQNGNHSPQPTIEAREEEDGKGDDILDACLAKADCEQ